MYHTFVSHIVVHVVHKLKCGTKSKVTWLRWRILIGLKEDKEYETVQGLQAQITISGVLPIFYCLY